MAKVGLTLRDPGKLDSPGPKNACSDSGKSLKKAWPMNFYSEGVAGSLQVKSQQETLRLSSSLSVIVPVFKREAILPALM